MEPSTLNRHLGAHPRLGVVDDIVFHPLAQASLDEAAWIAKAVAAEIGNRFQGWCHPTLTTSPVGLRIQVPATHHPRISQPSIFKTIV